VEFIQFLILFTLLISRLLPSANRILLQSSTIRSNEYVFDYLKDLIPFIAKKDEQEVKTAPIIFEERITIKDLTFSYEEHQKPLFTRLNMTIRKGSSIGIIGPSGSGKTTLLHILLRLLREDSGGIYVDNVQLDHANKLSWYSLIGYVPQNINLIDGDFAENIAFGVAAADIDMERVKRVAELAQLHEFIEKQPDNYRTAIGEGGLKISGGQRQRVGIARALYHDAQLLIFDEATSALDVETEEMITESLRVLNTRRMTTIVVAHRLQTLRYCDEIYSIEQGKLSDKMKYSDL
jgi:HlyD family secretion protein